MKCSDDPAAEASGDPGETITRQQAKSAWARMMVRLRSPQVQKIYEVDPLVCPKCGEKMRVLSVITDRQEIRQIMEHLKRNKAPPFDVEYTRRQDISCNSRYNSD